MTENRFSNNMEKPETTANHQQPCSPKSKLPRPEPYFHGLHTGLMMKNGISNNTEKSETTGDHQQKRLDSNHDVVHRLQTWPMLEHHDIIESPQDTMTENIGPMKISTIISHRPDNTSRRRGKIQSTVNHDLLRSLQYNYRNSIPSNQSNLHFSTVNTRSIRNKTESILHHMETCNLDICAITESWIKPDDIIEINELRSTNFNFEFCHRKHRTGGGTAILYKKSLNIKLSESNELHSFEYSLWKVTSKNTPLDILIIYRPPSSQQHTTTISGFIDELSGLLTKVLPNCHNLIICGDFNIHYDNHNDNSTAAMNDLLKSFGLHQHVMVSTHKSGHILDYIITAMDSQLLVTPPTTNFFISDHCFVSTSISLPKPEIPVETITYRRVSNIDKTAFEEDIELAVKELLNHDSNDVNILVNKYDDIISSIFNKHAPLISKRVPLRKKVPWFDINARDLKRKKRKCERLWRKTKSQQDSIQYNNACNAYKLHLSNSKHQHINDKISQCEGDSKKLFNVVKELTGNGKKVILPDTNSLESLAQDFCDFFIQKIAKIREDMDQCEIYIPQNETNHTFSTLLK
jgi:exonuclease III